MDTQHRNLEEQKRQHMLTASIPQLVTELAVPTTMIQIISVVYNAADTYFVSHLGKSAAAAVGVGFSLMSIIQAIGMGFGMGAGSMISRQLGAKEQKKANVNANSALFASIVVAVLFAVVAGLYIEPFMRCLGSSDSMQIYAVAYAKYILICCPIMCASFVLNTVLRAEGSAKYAMFGITTGGIINIGLDPLFIYRFGWGIAGAAIATGISQLISAMILLLPFVFHQSVLQLHPKYISRQLQDYKKILTTGMPTICRQGLASVASALLNRKARLYGDAAVAAVTIATKMYLLVRNIVVGIGQGFQPVAGYNYGAGQKQRTKQAFGFACFLGTVICSAFAVVLFWKSKEVITWFQSDKEVVELGKTALHFACMAMPFMAYSTYVDQMYQCLGFAKVATFLACSRQGIMFLPIILIAPTCMGFLGVQIAQPLADVLSFVLCVPFQIYFFRKHLNGLEGKYGEGCNRG